MFRQYVDGILEVSANAADLDRAEAGATRLGAMEREMWSLAVAASKANPARGLNQSLLPALNDMFDILQTRLLVAKQHPPAAVFVMLGFLILVSSD